MSTITEFASGKPSGGTTEPDMTDRHLVAVLAVGSLAIFAFAALMRFNGGMSGDEPHYLAITQALIKYHTVDPTPVSVHGDYHAYYPPGALDEPHVFRGATGRAIPLHQFGGPLLWVLPFMLLGRFGVHLFMVAVSALIVVNVYYLQRELGIVRGYAAFVAGLFAIGTPLYIYSSMLFIEPIAALLVIFPVRVLLARRLVPLRLVLASAGLGYLPWIHGRLIAFTLLLGGLLAARLAAEVGRDRARPYVQALAPLGILLLGIEGFNLAAYGTLHPAPGADNIGAGLFQIPMFQGLTFLLLDAREGLLLLFPVLVLAFAGFLLSLNRRLAWAHVVILGTVLPYLLAISTFSVWWAGWSPPARFLSVITPVLAYYVAVALQQIHHWLMTSIALIAGLFALILSILSDVWWAERFVEVTEPVYKAWVHLGEFMHFDFVPFLPIALNGYAGRHLGLFIVWGVGLLLFTMVTWLSGVTAPQDRVPYVPLPSFSRLVPSRFSQAKTSQK